ncbi:hypothetical protein M0805_000444 [Coniferiporia weirii]|nr:hypothetical protein M0805_000444 [Coniferiporia weirii]
MSSSSSSRPLPTPAPRRSTAAARSTPMAHRSPPALQSPYASAAAAASGSSTTAAEPEQGTADFASAHVPDFHGDADLARYLLFDSFAASASPPPASPPTSSFAGSPASWSAAAPLPASPFSAFSPLASPHAPPPPSPPALSSPDFPMDYEPDMRTASGPGMEMEGLSLFAGAPYHAYGYDPFASEFVFSPWDDLDMLQSAPADFKDSAQQQLQQQQQQQQMMHPQQQSPSMQQQQQHQQTQSALSPSLFLPSHERGDDLQRQFPAFAPYTPPSIAPRELLRAPPAPDTPYWAAQLWEDRPPSAGGSDGSFFVQDHNFFAPMPPAPPPSAAIAIPNAMSSQQGQFTSQSSPALTQLFQPSSAPAHAGGFVSGAVSSAGASRSSAGGTRSGTIRARVRSYSQRAGSGLRDALRAVSLAGRSSATHTTDTDDAFGVKQEGTGDTWDDVPPAAATATFSRSVVRRRRGVSDACDPVSVPLPPSMPASLPSSSSFLSQLHTGGTAEDRDATVRNRKRPSSHRLESPSPRLRLRALDPDAPASASGLGLGFGFGSGSGSGSGSVFTTSPLHSRETSSEKETEKGKDKESLSLSTAPERDPAVAAAPLRSELRPPKLAPSTWQLYFTDWIQRHQMTNGEEKLNVARAAKQAGAEYASLTPEQKEPYKRRSLAAKEAREREHTAWQRTLTPEDIKRENQFRTAQRKAGKSRKGNIKDPNAPKKPLSAYFMFLQHIRADGALVREVFGDERETTAQSVLAAQKWRSMTDEERKPFLAQAEREKLAYEAARRMYEEGTVGFESTISFNVNVDADTVLGAPLGDGASATATATTFVIGRPAAHSSSSASPSASASAYGNGYGYGYGYGQEQEQGQGQELGNAPLASSDSEPDSEGFSTDEERERPRPRPFRH